MKLKIFYFSLKEQDLMVHSSFPKVFNFLQIQVTFLPRRTFIHRLKWKGSLSWVLLLKRVSYQRNCGAASVDEYNKIIWIMIRLRLANFVLTATSLFEIWTPVWSSFASCIFIFIFFLAGTFFRF